MLQERNGQKILLSAFYVRWAEGLLLLGDLPEAKRIATRALQLAEAHEERGMEASALELLGEIVAAEGLATLDTAILNGAMTSTSSIDANAVVQAYDFSGIRTLVDVGGGHGLMLASVLKAKPHMRGILFELPHAIEGAAALLQREGVTDRCELVDGDFFRSVPEGGDAYMLKLVVHDWDDDRALQILRNCHRVMRPKTRLILVDYVLRPGDEPDFGKFVDLEMLVLTAGGRERTEPEFRDLFAKAGFELTQIVRTATAKSVIEGVRL